MRGAPGRSPMLSLPRAIALCLGAAAFLVVASSATSGPTGQPGLQGPPGTTQIQHLVVVQLENWSFDSLFGTFPGVDGLTPGLGTPMPLPQTDKLGTPLTSLPGPYPTCSPLSPTPTTVPPGCFPTMVAAVLFSLGSYLDPNRDVPPDTIHEFFREQFQINGARMDQFAAWNDLPCLEFCGGAVLSYWDLNAIATTTPSIAHLARNYTLADKYHHAMFGA